MKLTRSLAAVAAMLALAPAAPALAADPLNPCAASAPNSSHHCVLDFRGSTTLRPISDRARFVFQSQTGIESKARALGSTTGTRAIVEGTCAKRGIPVAACDINGDGVLDVAPDIAQSSRPMNAGEKAKALANDIFIVENVVAKDGLAIIVNNNVAAGVAGFSLTLADINSLYTNPAATDWTLAFGVPGGTIKPVSRTPEGGTYGSFLDLYICVAPGQTCPTNPVDNVRAPATPPFRSAPPAAVTFVGSNDEIVEFVRNTPGAIGYVGIAFLDATVKNVPMRRSVADPPVAATFQTVQNGTFAFSRFLYNYTVDAPLQGNCIGRYLDYLYSRQGQANVVESGYVPIYGVSGFADGGTIDVASPTQTLLEPIAGDILDADALRVAEKLQVIAEAEGVLAGNPQDANALTDRTESETSLKEMVEEDETLVGNVVARADTCLGSCAARPKDCQRAARELAEAQASMGFAASAAAAEDYYAFLEYLRDALRSAQSSLSRSLP